jgi:hypothetical protein
VIKSRRLKRAGHVAVKEGDNLEDSGVNERISLIWVFKKLDRERRINRFGSGQGQVTGLCECGNFTSVSIKYGEFLEYWKTFKLLSEDSAP